MILGVHIGLEVLAKYRCHTTRKTGCQYTGKPHIPLSGTDPQGVWWTKRAEPYPNQFTKLLAKLFCNIELSMLAQEFQRHLG